ncbi:MULTISPECIES: hypothetical protein [Corynebacterium]|nr:MULTISPECIES: hypothetical protein [Corynebacterium]
MRDESLELLARATGVLEDDPVDVWPWWTWIIALLYGLVVGLGFGWAIVS